MPPARCPSAHNRLSRGTHVFASAHEMNMAVRIEMAVEGLFGARTVFRGHAAQDVAAKDEVKAAGRVLRGEQVVGLELHLPGEDRRDLPSLL